MSFIDKFSGLDAQEALSVRATIKMTDKRKISRAIPHQTLPEYVVGVMISWRYADLQEQPVENFVVLDSTDGTVLLEDMHTIIEYMQSNLNVKYLEYIAKNKE